MIIDKHVYAVTKGLLDTLAHPENQLVASNVTIKSGYISSTITENDWGNLCTININVPKPQPVSKPTEQKPEDINPRDYDSSVGP